MVNFKQFQSSVCRGCWVLLALMLVGCRGPFDRRIGLTDLEHPNPAVKIMAIKWAGDNKISSAVPQLVDFLQSEDKPVRLYSIEALRRITGTDNGYDYKAAPHLRAEAVKRWREFIDANELLSNEHEHKKTTESNKNSD
ncbi:MAG: HEAT repeat domain-containing protein [Planctomycetota bacterium]|jgi:hypothetical protein